MALTTETRTVNGTNIDFYVARDDAGDLSGILIAGLSPIDEKVLTAIDADGTGADLQEKMEGYTLSNGENAFAVYGDQIVNIDAYEALRQRQLYRANPSQYLESQATTIADHEARITALEP